MFIYNLRLNVPIYGWQIIEKKEKENQVTSLWRIDWRKQSSVDFKCLDFELGVPNIRDLLTCETDFYWHLDIHSLELIGEGYIYTDSHGNLVLLVRGRSKEHNQDAVMTQVAPADGKCIVFLSILWIFLALHTALVYRLLHMRITKDLKTFERTCKCILFIS